MKQLKVLELFSGTESISKEFRKKGHKTLTVDYNPIFSEPNNEYGIITDLNMDIMDLTPEIVYEKLGGEPDIIWASVDCTTYSIAAISHHRNKEEDGNLAPKSEKAKKADELTKYTIKLIEELNPKLFYIENPRGALRKMNFIKHIPRYTVTYCRYGDERMKPTDIWTNHPTPQFKPMCKNGDPCHVSAPRGSKTGTQGLKNNIERSRIPSELAKHIVHISEEYLR